MERDIGSKSGVKVSKIPYTLTFACDSDSLAAYDIKVHNLLAFARPSGSMNFNGFESGHAQQHVLHHTAMARNSTEQVIDVAMADPIMKHLYVAGHNWNSALMC